MCARDFENIRQVRARLNAAKDSELASLSTIAMVSVENILQTSGGAARTAAYHTITQKYENLDAALKRMNESMRFLEESQGELKREWEDLWTMDAGKIREALFSLLTCCESLDISGAIKHIKSESLTIGKVVDRIKKIKGSDPKAGRSIAKLSCELEAALRTLDSILGGTLYPATEFDAYSKFSDDLEDFGERSHRLNESLRFFEDIYTREDWKHFMEQDLEQLRGSLETVHDTSIRLADIVK